MSDFSVASIRRGWPLQYPAATADLLLVYFSVPDLHVYIDETLQNIWRALVKANLDSQHLRQVREAMFRFGFDPNDWAKLEAAQQPSKKEG
jgi:membrane-bound lytic murein transglycosylase MltF